MTTGHNIDNLYTFDDPLGFQPALPTNFPLSTWQSPGGFDSDSDESDDEEDGDWDFSTSSNPPLPQEKPSSTPGAVAPQRESSSCSALPVCVRNTRVRFSEQPEVRCYEQVDREFYGILFYSCHELQKMIDEAKDEKEVKAN